MRALWDETAGERERDPDGYRFPPIFAARQPVLSNGFVTALDAQNAAYGATMLRIGNDVIALFANCDAMIAPSEAKHLIGQ